MSGAAATGLLTVTATSFPGFALMVESINMAFMMELPMIIEPNPVGAFVRRHDSPRRHHAGSDRMSTPDFVVQAPSEPVA